MDWTDTHCRAFRRVVAPKALLCTEMVHVSAVIHRDRPRLQGFDASEHPVAPQLGGSDPALPGVAAQVHERGMLERLCRPIARPAVAEKRLSVSTLGRIRCQRKTPRRNDTTHVGFEPIDFIAEPTALRSPARALTRLHGMSAPNARRRVQWTPSGRGRQPAGDAASTTTPADDRTPRQQRRSMTWAPTPRARVRRRRDDLRPLRRGNGHRGQHRRAQGDPRHSCPLRKARRAG